MLTHSQVGESTHQAVIDVDVNITMTYPWALQNAYCYYKVNNVNFWDSNSTWVVLPDPSIPSNTMNNDKTSSPIY